MELSKPHISVVSPEYKGEKMVHEFVERVVASVTKITDNYEIILVNDASPDNTWEAISAECAANPKVKGLNLSRNFGQHYAITAGLRYATGDWVVVMDCDLQDVPEEISNLYKKAQEGNDTVLAQRVDRDDSCLKKTLSKLFYRLFSYLTETKQDSSVANYGIYRRPVIESILSMGDKFRYLPAMTQWVGYSIAYLPVEHSARTEGKSSYNFKRQFNLAMDTIIAFSDKPMRLMVKFGFVVTSLSIIVGTVFLFRYLIHDIKVPGFTSLILSVCIFSGIIISFLGVVGLYIGKMFDTVKDRPTYIVKEHLNFSVC